MMDDLLDFAQCLLFRTEHVFRKMHLFSSTGGKSQFQPVTDISCFIFIQVRWFSLSFCNVMFWLQNSINAVIIKACDNCKGKLVDLTRSPPSRPGGGGGVEVHIYLHSFLTSRLDGGEW
jgi:hypothetical protein